jgi:hypothetical protein
MINDKVFLLIWLWHGFLVIIGCLRVSTRSSQVLSSKVRFFLIKMNVNRYFRNNAHMKHIRHYVCNCSIGDWFVLHQMSKNINKRYFAEFLALLAMTVDPDPNIEPEEREINLSPESIEKIKSSTSSDYSDRRKKSYSSISDDGDEEDGDEVPEKKPSFFSNLGEDYELDTGFEASGGGGSGGGITGKQRMLIKLGKKAKSANKGALMAAAAMKRSRKK